MKKYTLLIILIALFSFGGFAQPRKDRAAMHKEFLEFKMKFMAREIELRDDQKKEFFEVYEQMSNERFKVMREAHQARKRVEGNKKATEADYKAASEALSNVRAKESQIDKKYEDKFAAFLSQKQIFKMKEAEMKFRDTLKNMRKRGRGGKKR